MKYSYFVPELLLISSSLAGRIWKINWPHMAHGPQLAHTCSSQSNTGAEAETWSLFKKTNNLCEDAIEFQ